MQKKTKHFVVELGTRIKAIRCEKGLTQAQLAADIDIEISQISRIERGVINTSIGNLYNLSIALNVKLSEIFRIIESPN